jgi:hypothetical protein
MPELSLTVTGAPMISLRKPLGSLESPAESGAGLSPLVDIVILITPNEEVLSKSKWWVQGDRMDKTRWNVAVRVRVRVNVVESM